MSEVRVPDNEFTRMIAATTQHNRVGRVEEPVNAGSLPQSRSAALGVVNDVPLSAEEVAERDAALIALGINPSDDSGEGTNYATREAAEAAGAPVNPPREQLDAVDVTISPLFARPGRIIPVDGRSSFPRLPDFSKPAVLDLGRGYIYLDGLEFPIPEADLAEFRVFAITTVHASITALLNAALAKQLPPEETHDGGDEAVLPLRDGTPSEAVQSEESS
jgi:hypothetical protein